MTKRHTVVFVSGNFFALHPGHVRLLRFAADCGDRLVVGVSAARLSPDVPPPEERAEALRELGIVDEVVILREGVTGYLNTLRPQIVVKGKEFENTDNPEESVLSTYGGKLLFSSGESTYSGAELLRFDARDSQRPLLTAPHDFLKRHGMTDKSLRDRIARFAGLPVLVVGDFIMDEYVHCEALGMSREDPTLVVSPRATDRFLGGAGIVAAHAAALGGVVTFLSVVGADDCGADAGRRLAAASVDARLLVDDSRPTTLKQRFRTQDKTLLRVSHLRQHEIQRGLQQQILDSFSAAVKKARLVIFSDFNYGCLPQRVVEAMTAKARDTGAMTVADSQSSSQVGDVSRFKGTKLLSATEHEARLALRDQTSGLAAVGFRLLAASGGSMALVKLGAAGVLIVVAPPGDGLGVEDRLPALNLNPRDVSGAGDSMLTASAMALASGAAPWEAAYLGAVAAGIQTSRIGNLPIGAADVLGALGS
jgi:rfaE bifunctional protein kinase chain/domain